tara:strand:- start:4654 stop:5988 length:1335 start_codon:yes stop_codon:yes gene_type:complete
MNAELVKAVTAAYHAQAAQADFATPISNVLSSIQKSFEKRAQESLAKNRANQAKITGFNQKEIDQLTIYKDEYDSLARKLANPLLGREKKKELNAQLNAVNEKTTNFITGVNRNMALQNNAIDVADSRSGQYNMQQKMFIDRAQVGDYRIDWTVDENGNVMIQDPMGEEGSFKNVLDFEPIKGVNIDFLNADTDLINTTTSLAVDLTRSKSQVESQIKNLISNNYMSDPTAIFDTEAVASGDFANYLANNEKFQAIVDFLPENDDFDQMLADGSADEDFHNLIYEIAKTKVDVKEFWIDFNTKKHMGEFDRTRARKLNELEGSEEAKGKNDKVYSYHKGQYTFRPSEITSEYKSLSNMKVGDTRAWPFGDAGTKVSVVPKYSGDILIEDGVQYALEKSKYPGDTDPEFRSQTTVEYYDSLEELWMANLGMAAPEQYMISKSKLP